MLHISKMSGKLEGFYAINTNTKTNPFCKSMQKGNGVCRWCYAEDYLNTFRASCEPAYERNSRYLSLALIPEEHIPFLNIAYVRFNAYGELINKTHFLNLCAIARRNPGTMFSLWTKRKVLVQQNISHVPENMLLIYSSPKMDREENLPKHFHKVFTVFSEDAGNINCTKHCASCMKCYTMGGDTFIREIMNIKLRRRYNEARGKV